MNYIIFGLGSLLAAAGCLSIYAGYDIIEVERGWTEVISGTTALAGGIVTIALSTILWRLKVLCGLYEASTHNLPAPPPAAAFSPPMTAPKLNADSVEHVPVAAFSAAPFAADHSDQPNFGSWNAELETLAIAAAAQVSGPILCPEPAPIEADPITASPDLEAAGSDNSRDLYPIENTATPSSSSGTLSLDEMWKRVAGEMEKPIFPLELENPPAAVAPAVAIESETAWLFAEEALQTPESVLATKPNTALAGTVEEPTAEAPATVEISAAYLLGGMNSAPAPIEHDPIEQEPIETERDAPPLPVEPPLAEPAVIGRYEAEGTAYIMFADGSIEAQSETGVFHFASMAELKAFIEDRQTAEV